VGSLAEPGPRRLQIPIHLPSIPARLLACLQALLMACLLVHPLACLLAYMLACLLACQSWCEGWPAKIPMLDVRVNGWFLDQLLELSAGIFVVYDGEVSGESFLLKGFRVSASDFVRELVEASSCLSTCDCIRMAWQL
jgi:hypothetical protein